MLDTLFNCCIYPGLHVVLLEVFCSESTCLLHPHHISNTRAKNDAESPYILPLLLCQPAYVSFPSGSCTPVPKDLVLLYAIR